MAGEHAVSRRTLIAGGTTTLLAAGTGAWMREGPPALTSSVYRWLELDGPNGRVPDVEARPVVYGTFRSARLGGQLTGYGIAKPPGPGRHDRLPVLIVLHGLGRSHADVFDEDYLGAHRFLAAAIMGGVRPFAIASVDGGAYYWHKREAGADAAAMVIEEFLPLLAAHGLMPDRVALTGWSMGGFGALHIAASLGPQRVSAVSTMSAALCIQFEDTTPGAFDDEVDFERHTPHGRQAALTGIPIRIDCGRGDSFAEGNQEYVDGFSDPPEGGFALGDHDIGYWRRIFPHHVAHAARCLP